MKILFYVLFYLCLSPKGFWGILDRHHLFKDQLIKEYVSHLANDTAKVEQATVVTKYIDPKLFLFLVNK